MKSNFKLTKKTWIVLIICILLVAGSVGFLVWYDKKKVKKEPAKEPINDTPVVVSVFPLKNGSKNDYVKSLQRKINEYLGYYYFNLAVKPPYQNLSVDGIFGAKTEACVSYIFKTTQVTENMYNSFINSQINNDKTNWLLTSEYSFLNFK